MKIPDRHGTDPDGTHYLYGLKEGEGGFSGPIEACPDPYREHPSDLFNGEVCKREYLIDDLRMLAEKIDDRRTFYRVSGYLGGDVCTERHYPKGRLDDLTKNWVCGCDCHKAVVA